MTHIPYKGAGPATIDLISGQVTWMFGTILPTLPHVRAGKLRAFAVSGRQRAAVLPEVPTVAEQVPGFEASSWYGVFAPAATPADVIVKLNQEMARALNAPEVRQRLAARRHRGRRRQSGGVYDALSRRSRKVGARDQAGRYKT